MDSHNAKKHKKLHRLEYALSLVICCFLITAIAAPFAFGYYYKTRFFPQTTIAGINVSNYRLNDAKNLFSNRVGDISRKEITLKLADENYRFTAGSIGLKYDWHKALNDAFQSQRDYDIWHDGFNLVKNLITDKKTTIQAHLGLNQKLLNDKVDTMLKSVNRDPINANIHADGDHFTIDKETYGLGVDKENLKEMIKYTLKENLLSSSETITLNFPSTQLEPKIKETDLIIVKTQAENLIKNAIILTFEDKKYTYRSQNMTKWVKFETKNDQTVPSIDRTAITKDISTLAKKIDIHPRVKLVSKIDNSTLQEGQDGRALNQTKTTNDIILAFSANQASQLSVQTNSLLPVASAAPPQEISISLQVDSKPFETKNVAPPFNPGMYPGHYIEVNLSNQTMYLWDGTNLVKQFRVSTGKKSTPTREGTFSIRNKASVGKDFPWIMPWWMAFAQDRWGAWQGIHELPVDMRTGRKEGIRDIGYAVSHGCIRLAVGAAKEVYNWAQVGDPVYVHK